MIWQIWWVWVVAGIGFGILEIFAPGFFFLGFGIGAALAGGLLWLSPEIGLSVLLLTFAVLSLVAWLGLRRMVGVREGQVKIWDRDINED